MATTLTSNLKLRLDSGLTADSRYNLQRLDLLGSVYQIDTNQDAKMRSASDIYIFPEDTDIGGSGTGGLVQIGTSDQPATLFKVYADAVSFSTAVGLEDQATGGDKKLNLGYKSDISGAVDTAADRTLLFDLEDASRNMTLGGDFSINDSLTFTLGGATTLTLPTSGTVASDDNSLVLTNKTISALANTITDIKNVNIDASAAIAGTKITPSFGAQEVNSTTGFSTTASVVFKLPSADGSVGEVLSTDGAGQLGFAVVATTDLDENHIRVGNSSNVDEEVDTDALGDIQATTAGGLTIKSDVIVNADINSAAAIALTKLAAVTASSALESDGSGNIIASSVTSTELGYVSGVTSALQTQLDNKQPLDDELTALAAIATNGLYTRTGAGTVEARTITAGSAKISVADGDGVSGNPTVDLGTVSTDDLTEGTALFFTDERAQDAVGTILTDTASIDFTYDDGSDQITAVVLPAGVDHDSLNNFVADEHVAHTGVSIVAGGDDGLTLTNNDLSSNIGLAVDINGTTAETTVESADSILIYDSTATALRSATLANVFAGVQKKTFKDNWEHTDGPTIIITHSIGTLDVRVEVYDTADGTTLVPDTVTRNNANQVTITGANLPATFDFRVLISEV